MTDRLGRLIRGLIMGGLLLTTLVVSTPVLAQGTEPPCPPSIAFLDERGITVDFDEISEGEQWQLEVDIRNNDPDNPQSVKLGFVGADPALSQLLSVQPEEQSVSPLQIGTFTLTLETANRPEAGSYEAILVATSSNGDIVRRTFSLTVSGEEEEEPGDLCEAAKQLLDNGELVKAEGKYVKILESHKDEPCAIEGLRQVREGYCLQAENLLNAGLIDDAKAKYEELMKSDPELECAIKGLDAIPTDYEKVEALHQIGLDDKAWEQLETAVKADPANDKLAPLASQRWAWWQRAGAFLKVYVLPLLVASAIALVVGLLIRTVRDRRRLKLDVEKFAPGLVEFKPDPSDMLVARIEQVLKRLSEADDKLHRPGLIDTPVEAPSLPADLASVPKEGKVVWDLLMKLYPPNTITLSGVLQYDVQKGAGLSLRLVHGRNNELLGSYTVWQRDVNPDFSSGGEDNGKAPAAADYFQLTEAAAIWTYWKTQEYVHRDREGDELHPREVLGGEKHEWRPRHVFGTDNWRSYIAGRIGTRLLDAGKQAVTEQMLRGALTHDRKNRHALFNLAVIEVEKQEKDKVKEQLTQGKEPYEKAKVYFDRVKQLSKDISAENEPACIFADYQLGAMELYKYVLTDGKYGNLETAVETLKTAVEKAEKLEAITEGVRATLEIAYACAVLLAMQKAMKKYGDLDPWKVVEDIEGKKHFEPSVLYNLACFYSTAVGFVKLPEETKCVKLKKALGHLEDIRAGVSKAEWGYYARWVREDPSLNTLSKRKKQEFDKIVPPKKDPPMPTPVQPGNVAFDLPATKIKSDLSILNKGAQVVVIVVVERKDLEGKVVAHKAYRHSEATVIDGLDAGGTPLPVWDADQKPIDQPYKKAHTVRIRLAEGANAVRLSAHLADASALYLVLASEPPTPSQTEEGKNGT